MFGLKERHYPAHVLISLWCDSDNNFFFKLRIRILADISVLLTLASIKINYYSYTPLLGLFLNICSRPMHIGPREFAQ